MEDAGGYGIRILRDGPTQVGELDQWLEYLSGAVTELEAEGPAVVRVVLRARRRQR